MFNVSATLYTQNSSRRCNYLKSSIRLQVRQIKIQDIISQQILPD